jgi:hypothetical protein
MDTITSLENSVPDKYKWLILAASIIVPMLGRAYHSVRSGGGLKGIWNGLIFGTNAITPPQSTANPNEKTTPPSP